MQIWVSCTNSEKWLRVHTLDVYKAFLCTYTYIAVILVQNITFSDFYTFAY